MPPSGEGSPYAAALGDRLSELHPRLIAYFSAIPRGMIGVGHGVFEIVGTPRRWLWPILRILERDSILFPVWERHVPFTVTNLPSAEGTVTAARAFEFRTGPRTMVDDVTFSNGRLVDRLGVSGRLVAALHADVVDGELHLASTRVGLVLLGRTAWLPAALAPRLRLVERYDDAADAQHVSVRLEHAMLGRLYEYAGRFTYELRPGERSA